MERRTHESPMDFEWQTSGPADVTSPFHQLAVKHQKSQHDGAARKRPHSIFDSPMKTTAPALAEPASQTYLFSPPPGSRALPNFRAPSFTTPRRLELDLCSSGPDIASSPDNADNEDTPDPPSRHSTLPAFTGSQSTQKTALSALTTRGSPGRGGLLRGRYSDAAARKIIKRRRHEANNRLILRASDDYLSSSSAESPSRRASSRPSSTHSAAPPQSALTSFLSTLESHPSLPHILSYYTQFLLNLFLALSFLYILYSFWSTIRSDVDLASEEARAATLADMAACASHFVANRCDSPSSRVPALEAVCDNWKRCMDRDPSAVGRARVSAHTFAQIFNGFVEPISYKAMVFVVVVVGTVVVGGNVAFALVRGRLLGGGGQAQQGWTQQQQQQQQMLHQGYYPPPQTPYATPARQVMMMEPGPSGVGTGMRPGMESPTRRGAYH